LRRKQWKMSPASRANTPWLQCCSQTNRPHTGRRRTNH
jgi:hypothetical protein